MADDVSGGVEDANGVLFIGEGILRGALTVGEKRVVVGGIGDGEEGMAEAAAEEEGGGVEEEGPARGDEGEGGVGEA